MKERLRILKQHIAIRLRAFGDHDPELIDESGARLWLRMLALGFVVIILGTVFHYRLYKTITRPLLVSEYDITPLLLDRQALDRALSVYQEKERHFDGVSKSKEFVSDPAR
ncbi:MAG: hypothetical protein COV10_00900 [Candidatus Vogelbacteria bacterium CG10_big_fil_rev_8_21_14_0_10_51_16]|uniref:Uncharacterized protein n=1 Tax=Candidatus Vogelbacteria bacterium CG10_big_fil_rev_8_21_14_0_10_51_16 TaxID=1975045 RepID=A0A2H0RF50_9BACT|nr:MAG: hypothetical protein COV10_00900 [Candidatus Vogelbacteria bacterium CG10_big_fil_rev_8_21_14_0_10_51_16]